MKLDTIQESMVNLARLEEKLLNIDEDRQRIWETLNHLKVKLEKIEKVSEDSQRTSVVIQRVTWLVGGGIVTGLIAKYLQLF